MTLRLGMSGPYVKSVQEFLKGLSLYRGPIDSSYGGGTSSAVKNFQFGRKLPVSGSVDAATWDAMFPNEPYPVSDLVNKPLIDRCLALTGSFETSSYPPESFCGLAGNFDGMGLSFGVCQWNIGKRTLQPLLVRMFDRYSEVARSIFQENSATLASLRTASLDDQLAFARSIQSKGQVDEPWRGMFRMLGRSPEFQNIQCEAASHSFQTALQLCRQFRLQSERGAALMFDIVTQNGSVDEAAARDVEKAFQRLPAAGDTETARMVIIGNEVANAAPAEHAADVRARKLAIAQGSGTVHGQFYDLTEIFGLGMTAWAETPSSPSV